MPPIQLDGELTIYRAAEVKALLHSALLQADLDRGVLPADRVPPEPIHLGMSGVSEFDGAGLQLLLGVSRWAQEHGTTVLLMDAPKNVLDVLDEFGVRSRFSIATGESVT